jgi:nucleoside-triphosphatase
MGLNWKGDASNNPPVITRQHPLASFLCNYSQMQTDNMATPHLTKPLAASLLSGEQVLTFLTGPRGAGKTSFCAEFVLQMQGTGSSIGGFICPAVFDGGKKVGIDLLDVASGERRRLGLRSQNKGDTTIGCWQLDKDVIAWGNQILAGLKNEQIIIIDELGPLELEKGYGYQEALHLLDEGRYRAALVVVRPALLGLARLRWPQAQVLDLEGESA